MAKNLPTYTLNAVAVAALDDNYPAGQFEGGMNLGSNSGNIGICTGVADPKESDFSRVEDTAAHPTQHIGGNGLAVGATTDFPLKVVNGADINNTVAFVEAGGAVAIDAVIDATTGARNRTGQALVSGDWAWGEIPVA